MTGLAIGGVAMVMVLMAIFGIRYRRNQQQLAIDNIMNELPEDPLELEALDLDLEATGPRLERSCTLESTAFESTLSRQTSFGPSTTFEWEDEE